jgi:hypothetical protein
LIDHLIDRIQPQYRFLGDLLLVIRSHPASKQKQPFAKLTGQVPPEEEKLPGYGIVGFLENFGFAEMLGRGDHRVGFLSMEGQFFLAGDGSHFSQCNPRAIQIDTVTVSHTLRNCLENPADFAIVPQRNRPARESQGGRNSANLPGI